MTREEAVRVAALAICRERGNGEDVGNYDVRLAEAALNAALGEESMTQAHYTVEPTTYERELADTVIRVVARADADPEKARAILAASYASHRSRVASLYLALFPSGDESEEVLRGTLKFAHDMVRPACPALTDDPRGSVIAKLLREKYEIEQAYRRTVEELEALQKQHR